ncbi:MAG: hypothetical protein COX42_01560, partial [Parcubacteria group bacterium CG23_combo_of_CG06-09_8_20_14_all_35_6]
MEKLKKPDFVLIIASFLLILIGSLILASTSAVLSMERFGNPNYFLKHQLLFGLLPGLFLGLIGFLVPLEKIKKISFWFFIF